MITNLDPAAELFLTETNQIQQRIAEANRGKQDSTQEAEKRGWLPRAGDFTIEGRAASQPPDHFEACQPGNRRHECRGHLPSLLRQ